eukprot:gnl/MRDRNA2_/MRDRNA2_139428_c0_seq1.p1 gnl/MRDRNA2_/MRDRNA2_139428_c0~~gnl/MRDRNA2_/MRDRNA2_139428_c0_seq1.p1  ORF type:complete len:352 (+),score=68.20 gnl/MRDRNA2_/MRDRNA2_139428_c0_seq1:118-1056(+)
MLSAAEYSQMLWGSCWEANDHGSCIALDCHADACLWPNGAHGSNSILLYADKSGSMCGRDCWLWGCDTNKMPLAGIAFKEARALLERSDFAKLSFVDEHVWQRSRLHRPDPQKYKYDEFVHQWGHFCGGRTRIWQNVLEDAKAVVANKPAGMSVDVIIITDGLDNESPGKLASPSGARELLSQLNAAGLRDVAFNIIGVGELDKEVSTAFETISGLTGGQSFMLKASSDVAEFSTRFIASLLEEARDAKKKFTRVRERKVNAQAKVRIYDTSTEGLVPYLMDVVQGEVPLDDEQKERVKQSLSLALKTNFDL